MSVAKMLFCYQSPKVFAVSIFLRRVKKFA